MTFSKHARQNSRLSFSAIITIVAFNVPPLYGQLGMIKGTVVDAEIGEGLPGANVIIDGTARGTATNLDGTYRLELEPGSYDVVFSFIGYSPRTVRGIVVIANESVDINIELGVDAVNLGDVVVDEVWEHDASVSSRTVDAHVNKIRKKIGDEWIETVTGVGYRFKE